MLYVFSSHCPGLFSTDSCQDAVTALNSLQTSFAVLQERRKRGTKMDDSAVGEMKQWISRAGHAVGLALRSRNQLELKCSLPPGF